MSKGSGLDSYKGLITPEQAAEGMNLAIRNARRLSVDAGLLLDLKSYPTAASLSALAIEECGKVSLLRRIALVTTESEAKKAWREYRNHRSKNGLWILPKLAKDGAIYLTQLSEAIDPKARHTSVLDGVKQIGFYTDCLGNAHWSDPESSIEEPLATGLVSIADKLSRMREVTIREMELWVQHLRPHNKTPQMATALLQWHKAMTNEGLAKESHEKFRDFVTGGGSVS
ncbi:AbiV family abortive infection protein [Roseibium album]|uniref:AbiV family abortive infection protein n=1 Tax=Roseibium album TaxID=311410 RepID=UPI002492C044|nr:AbiV family abortive infection protein [Roseibium album]